MRSTEKATNDLIEALANLAYAGAKRAGEFAISAIREQITQNKNKQLKEQ